MRRIEPVDLTLLKDLSSPVRFDDRLMTVLSQPAADRLDIAVRWRQLVDLVARAGTSASSDTVYSALETIRRDAENVELPLRAAAARAIAPFPLPLGLLEYFASDQLDVSAPVLAAATLDPAQWRALLESADADTRHFVATLHPEVLAEAAAVTGGEQKLLPPSDFTDELIAEPGADEAGGTSGDTPEANDLTDEQVEQRIELIAQMVEARNTPAAATAAPSLTEVVERIERRRRSRSAMRGALSPPPQSPSALFRWECGPGGEISWVDGAPRGALIGRSIARARNGEGDRVDRDVVRSFTVRSPFRDGTLTIGGEGSVAGEWKISGVPAFDPADGRFRGYRGIAIRNQAEPPSEQAIETLADPDSLRELVHEIKTPLNAIIGFAEIIEGQYLGPADRPYRERAHDIVKHARLLLLAIDDVDFAAKIHSAGERSADGASLADVIARLMPVLREFAAATDVDIEEPTAPPNATIRAEADLAERLIFRMCSAVVEQAEAGEGLAIEVERVGGHWRVSIGRPRRLSMTSEQLLGGEGGEEGFPLCLLRGLAGIAEATLEAGDARISLLFRTA